MLYREMSEEYAANKLTLRMEPEGEISASLKEVKFLSPAGLLRYIWLTRNMGTCMTAVLRKSHLALLCTSAYVRGQALSNDSLSTFLAPAAMEHAYPSLPNTCSRAVILHHGVWCIQLLFVKEPESVSVYTPAGMRRMQRKPKSQSRMPRLQKQMSQVRRMSHL